MNRLIYLAMLCLCVNKAICTMPPVEESGTQRSVNYEAVVSEQQQAIGILTSALENYKKSVEKDEILSAEIKSIYLNKYVKLAATLEENNFALLLHRDKMTEKSVQLLIANKSIIDQFKLELAVLIGQKNLVDMRELTEIESLLEEAFLNGKIFISSKEQRDAKAAAEHAVYIIETCSQIQKMPYFQAIQSGNIDFMGSELFKKVMILF